MSCSPATTTLPTKRWWPSWGARSQRIHTNVQVGTQILFIEVHNELCISFAVLVTDKVRRTAKFMCMVAKGVPIVGPGWLSQSKETKTFQGMIHTTVELSSFFILEIFFHPQILGYTLSRTKSPRRSGVSVSAGLSERLQRRLCSQITKFTRPSRWFLPLNSLKVQNSYQLSSCHDVIGLTILLHFQKLSNALAANTSSRCPGILRRTQPRPS